MFGLPINSRSMVRLECSGFRYDGVVSENSITLKTRFP